jgi:hypothetical protein
MGQVDLFNLIHNEREEAQGEGDHQSDSAFRNKWNRPEKPDDGILKVTGTGHGREKNCKTENQPESPAGECSQPQSLHTYRKPWDGRKPGALSEEGLEEKEHAQEDHPDLKIMEKLPERKSRKDQKTNQDS